MIDSWASSIYAEHLFAFEIVVIDDQLTYLEVALLQSDTIVSLYYY